MAYYQLKDKIPNSEQKIAVDTQILYWIYYAVDNYLEKDVNEYRISNYSNYIKEVLNNKNEIVIFGGVLIELFRIIERNEYQIYLQLSGKSSEEFTIKNYRNIDDERKTLQRKLNIVYNQIKQTYTICYEAIDSTCCLSFIEDFKTHKADFTDYSIAKLCELKGIKYILTDDKDFQTITTPVNIISGNKSFFKKHFKDYISNIK